MAQAQLRALLDEEGIPPDPPDLSLPVSEDLPDPSSSDLSLPVLDNPEHTQDSQSDLSQSLLGKGPDSSSMDSPEQEQVNLSLPPSEESEEEEEQIPEHWFVFVIAFEESPVIFQSLEHSNQCRAAEESH